MMTIKYLFLSIPIVFYTTCSFSQKPLIDSSVYGKWPWVEYSAISNDGNYAWYTINNQPAGGSTLVILASQTDWKIKIPGAGPGDFTPDSRMTIFTKPGDSLGILTLGGSSVEYVPHVSSFKITGKVEDGWIAYQMAIPERKLVVRNFVTGKSNSFSAVTDYLFNEEGNVLLLQTEIEKGNGNNDARALQWVNLVDDQLTTIWEGIKASRFVFDVSGTRLAFISEGKTNNQEENSLWYYKSGTNKAEMLANDHSPGIDNGFSIGDIQQFTKNGASLFFTTRQEIDTISKPRLDAAKVNVWSYTDPKLQPQQSNDLDSTNVFRPHPHYSNVIHIPNRQIIRLGQKDAVLINNSEDVVLMAGIGNGGDGESNWNPASRNAAYLLSVKDGKNALKPGKTVDSSFDGSLSPGGKYLTYYDVKQKNHFSYSVLSGVVRNITQSIPTIPTVYDDDHPGAGSELRCSNYWLKADAAVLFYDQYDIWQVDPSGNTAPINLTNGYGRKHNIVFRLAMVYSEKTINNNERLLLSAFNRTNKDNGFYSKVLGKTEDPELLTMGPFVYNAPDNDPHLHGDVPLKARDAECYLVRRMSATQSPNYFYTTDFKTFEPLSDLQPEKDYNWLTTELHTWKTFDGSLGEGVLYKPENFDPKKRYPLIFWYYERLADKLNVYLEPKAAEGPIDIPTFVSNGYLVFTPDIHYKIGEPGPSAFNAVVSAANYLSKISWVDARKMGIQGHSFGGYETNYLVTHTTIFAAALSAAGVSDCISDYGSLWGFGASEQGINETGQIRMGASLWQRADLYIKNSPIFRADKVTTPILLMNNKGDGAVPFAQGVEFFTALRRLGKKVWMLQYDGEDHTLDDEKDTKDYTIRVTQFFDHYLKGTPAPKWMLDGIPARLKGIDDGLQLDTTGRTPGPAL
jgi:dienelactone hydrolase